MPGSLTASIVVFGVCLFSTSAYSANPAVKKSKSGICHPQHGSYYSRTKNFTAYDSMEACLKAGGGVKTAALRVFSLHTRAKGELANLGALFCDQARQLNPSYGNGQQFPVNQCRSCNIN